MIKENGAPKDSAYDRQLGSLFGSEDEEVQRGYYFSVINRMKTFGANPEEMARQVNGLINEIKREMPRLKDRYTAEEAGNYENLIPELEKILPQE